jgi:hypothetical protein
MIKKKNSEILIPAHLDSFKYIYIFILLLAGRLTA